MAESHLLRRVLVRLYGDGLAGWAASIVAERSIAALRASTQKEPELLDVSRLRPGETYLVTTRPAPRRKERQLAAASEKAHARLEKAERPSRKLRRTSRRLRIAKRRLARTRAGSRRERKATAVVLQLANHVERQKALLEQFAPLVKPGARLIYGTCSMLREENEDVVAAFLARHPEFSVLPPADRLGQELGAKVDSGGFLRVTPGQHGTDGFFGATLVRARSAA